MRRLLSDLSCFVEIEEGSVFCGWGPSVSRLSAAVLFALCLLCAGEAISQQAVPASEPIKIDGAPLFSQNCAACHGGDGRGGERAPNIATRHEVVALADAELHDVISKGRLANGMPGFAALGEEKVSALLVYLRFLQGITGASAKELPGDPQRGEKEFFKQGACVDCHMVNGRGGFMGEDLSDYGRGRPIESIRDAILHPEATGNSGSLITVELAGGTRLKGLIRSQDNFNLVLQSADGAFHSLARSNIKQSTVSTVPYMPQDYEKRLDKQQIDDLVSYLMKSAAQAKTPSRAHDNDD